VRLHLCRCAGGPVSHRSRWGAKCAHSTSAKVWGGLIHRRLVAGRQFALKKLDRVAPRHPSRTLTHHEHYYRQQESRQKSTTGFQRRWFPSKIWTNSSSQVKMHDPMCCKFSLSPLPSGTPHLARPLLSGLSSPAVS
jgi:hypothetical protein